MKQFSDKLTASVIKLNSPVVRLVLVAISTALFVLAAGAPEAGGGIGL